MSRLMKLGGLLAAIIALAVPTAVQAQSSPVKAVVAFRTSVSQSQRVAAVKGAGGRVLKVSPKTVTARMTRSSADALRTAMGVVSVTIRR